MPDSTFEIAFSDLAHASLAEKAPGLMEYLVGFQLLDKNDEDTHAVAVFGFKLGNQWFYAPVFFLNGALRGLELLYVKSQDLFVPLQDNWVNYLVSKKPRNIGQTEQVPENDLDLEAPDFRVFSESPGTSSAKWASVIPTNGIQEWARGFLPGYKQLVDGFTKKASELSDRMDLKAVLRRNPELTPNFVATMKSNVKFAEAVLRFYDMKDLLPSPATVKKALLDLSPKPAMPGSTPGTPKPIYQKPVSHNMSIPMSKVQGKAGTSGDRTGMTTSSSSPTEKSAELVGDNHTYETKFYREYQSTDDILRSLTWKGKEK